MRHTGRPPHPFVRAGRPSLRPDRRRRQRRAQGRSRMPLRGTGAAGAKRPGRPRARCYSRQPGTTSSSHPRGYSPAKPLDQWWGVPPANLTVPNGCIPLITGWALASVAIATSIDAAVAGVTIAFLEQPVVLTCAIIGIVTFLLSSAGVLLGGVLGLIVGRRAELVGGLVLIGLGCKILVEHQFLGGG